MSNTSIFIHFCTQVCVETFWANTILLIINYNTDKIRYKFNVLCINSTSVLRKYKRNTIFLIIVQIEHWGISTKTRNFCCEPKHLPNVRVVEQDSIELTYVDNSMWVFCKKAQKASEAGMWMCPVCGVA